MASLKKSSAWEHFARWVRERDNHICFTCGKVATEAGHFAHQRLNTFFNEKNVHAQCGTCNRWMHGNLGVYAIRLDKTYGQGTAEELMRLSRIVRKSYSAKEKKDIVDKYKTYPQD